MGRAPAPDGGRVPSGPVQAPGNGFPRRAVWRAGRWRRVCFLRSHEQAPNLARWPPPAVRLGVFTVGVSWLLVTYGVTLVVTGSKLTAPLRNFLASRSEFWAHWSSNLIRCPMCAGWWVGLALSLVLPGLCPVTAGPAVVVPLANAFAASAACWMVHVTLARLGSQAL